MASRVCCCALLRFDDVAETLGEGVSDTCRFVILVAADHARVDQIRAQAGDLDAAVAVRHLRPLGESERPVLGERVAHRGRSADQRGRRQCLDQVPATLREHARNDGLGRPDMGEQIDPRDLLYLLGGRLEAESAGDAGVGAEDPYGTERGDGPLDQCADGLRAGHISRYRQAVDPLRHLLCPRTVTIGHDDVGTFGGEAFGQGTPDAVPAARDDDALSPKVGWRCGCRGCHDRFPLVLVAGPVPDGTLVRRPGTTELSQHSS